MFGSQQPTTGFSGFGQPAQQQTASFAGFGTNTTQPTSAFGTTQSTASPGFGTQQQTTGFTGFGATQTTGFNKISTSSQQGFGNFGASQTATAGFGGFGQQQPTASGFSGFGTQTSSQQPQPSLSGFSTFSNQANQQPGFSAFGTQPTSTATGFSGFGNQASQPPSTSGFSSFGSQQSKPSGFSGFGQQTQQTATQGFSGFGNTSTQPFFSTTQQPSSFGFSGQSFGTSFGLSSQQQQVQSYGILSEPLNSIKKKYAPYVDGYGNPIMQPVDNASRPNGDCKFAFISFKRFDEWHQSSTKHLIDIPKDSEIARNNPNPELYFPSREYGVVALQNKFEMQSKTIQKDNDNLKDLKSMIDSIDKTNYRLKSRYDSLKSKYAYLQISLVNILRKIEVIRCRSTPFQPSEFKYRQYLDKLITAIREPNQKLLELTVLESQIEKQPDTYTDSVSDEDIKTLYSLLEKQRTGIDILSDIIKKDVRDMNIIVETLSQPKKIES